MAHSRIISIRKLGAPLPPTIVKVKAYPTAIDEILTSELAAQYLRTLRILRGKTYQLINNYLDGKISEEELKREYVRYVKQTKDIAYTTMVLIDFSYLIEDLENSINLVEKLIYYICLNKNKLNNFNKVLIKNILNKNLVKILNYRKCINLVRRSIMERLTELQLTMDILRERQRKNRKTTASQRLDEMAARYTQHRSAVTELLAVQLSMNLGLTDCFDELIRLMEILTERKQLQTQLLAGEIVKEEYNKRILKIYRRMNNYKNTILSKMEDYKELKATINSNREYLKELLGGKSFRRLEKALKTSEKCLKIINRIIEGIESNEFTSTLEEY